MGCGQGAPELPETWGRLRIVEDIDHSEEEDRFFCIGRLDQGILTMRFTYRNNVIRIIGAGYRRKGRKIYEQENKIHR